MTAATDSLPDTPLPPGLPHCLRAELEVLATRYREAAAGSDAAAPLDGALLGVFAQSPFVAEFAIRRPGDFAALIADTAPRSRGDYDARVAGALADAADQNAAKAALRRLRQAEMVRIAWRDLHGGADVDSIMGELSDFADAVVATSVAWLHERLEARFGRAYGTDGEPLELTVIGMGKLGGHELNFSSDIDLLFVYGENGETRGGRRELPHQEYFDRVGRELIALLNETTAEGFVFRVDMRLRPFGDGGPLSSSLPALEHYYAVHGRDWERYALIKARALSGDAATVAQFEATVRPFVFRRYLDFGALDALREMKAMINREASSAELAGDVKRGSGGIREIEFTGQLFQLTRGGREPRLRDRSLVRTLDACAELGFLEPDDVATLLAAYRYLRTTEHRLQQVRDQQTHALPDDECARQRLAFAMGAADWDALRDVLETHREATRAHFAELLEAPADDGAGAAPWRDIWRCEDDADGLATRFGQLGHAASRTQIEVLLELKSERFLSRLSRQGRERLDRLMPPLLRATAEAGLSDAATRRLADLLHAIARRSVYLAFLADNQDALERLAELFKASPWIAEQIIAYPLLLDELLDPRALYQPPDRARLDEFAHLQVREEDGLEQAMDALRSFRNQQVLRVAASDVTGHLPVARVSDQLTFIAEACVNRGLEMAWHDLTRRFGAPCCEDEAGRREARFAVIAYGKLGGWELGYGSDLDLVFLHDSQGRAQHTAGPKEIENDVFFARLVQRFIHVLSTTTGAGVAYEIDTRLRPSGNAGLVVSPVTAYADYLAEKAWTWELQALVRARAVAGDAALIARFDAVRREALARPRDAAALAGDITTMRRRMRGELDRSNDALFDLKQGRGGMTDIEFVVQYAVLRWACEHPPLLVWTDNLRLLETIADLGLLPAESCRRLHDAYFAFRADIHRCALQQSDGLVEDERHREHRDNVVEIWNSVFA